MTPETVLIELLERVRAQYGGKIFITDHELNTWPNDAIALMKSHGLMTKTSPATSALCFGCERECMMPVHILTNSQDEPTAFIVCDKRSDINRVPVSNNQLESWQISVDSIAALLAKLLEIPHTKANSPDFVQWEIGVFKGKKHASHLVLLVSGCFKLALAGHEIALIEVLSLENKGFKIDKRKLAMLVDNPATGGGNDEFSADRKKRLTKRKLELQNQGQKKFLKLIAEEEGISVTRVKQLLSNKKKDSA